MVTGEKAEIYLNMYDQGTIQAPVGFILERNLRPVYKRYPLPDSTVDLSVSPTSKTASPVKIIWYGVIDSISTEQRNDSVKSTFHVEHRYFNFVMNYDENPFFLHLSKKGEGNFRLIRVVKMGMDSIEAKLKENYLETGNVIQCEGVFTENSGDSVLTIKGTRAMGFPKFWFNDSAENYVLQKDDNNNYVMDEKNYPVVIYDRKLNRKIQDFTPFTR